MPPAGKRNPMIPPRPPLAGGPVPSAQPAVTSVENAVPSCPWSGGPLCIKILKICHWKYYVQKSLQIHCSI